MCDYYLTIFKTQKKKATIKWIEQEKGSNLESKGEKETA